MKISQFPFSPPTLQGDGFILRGLELDDVEDLHASLTDDETVRWWMWDRVIRTPEDAADYIEEMRAAWDAGDVFTFVVEVNGRLSGIINFTTYREDRSIASTGFVIAPWARGEGLAARALRVAVRWVFTETGMSKLIGAVIIGNEASRKAARTVGFNHTRDEIMTINGEQVPVWTGALWRGVY